MASTSLSWARFDADTTRHTFDWWLIMPPGVSSYELYPSLPAVLDPFVMRPDDASHGIGVPAVTLIDFSEAADYDGARTLPEWALTVPGLAATFGEVEGAAIAHSYP